MKRSLDMAEQLPAVKHCERPLPAGGPERSQPRSPRRDRDFDDDPTSDPIPCSGTSDSAAPAATPEPSSEIARLVAQIVKAAPEAIETLRRNLACGRPAEELKAASVLLAHVEGGLALMVQRNRLEALTQAVEELRQHILGGQQFAAAARETGRHTDGNKQQRATVTNGANGS
jgi:hypothetical protein